MLEQTLAKYFHFSDFRPGQKEIVESIVAGNDVVALMPTGGGKSLCYQLPALLSDKLTIVISPLIALMKDQVDSLTARGIGAAFLNSSQTQAEAMQVVKAVQSGKIQLLYIAPERFKSSEFQSLFTNLPVGCVAVDEAHCVSSWGHDFRPDYLLLKEHIGLLPVRPTIAAFTATATPEVKTDIIERLGLREPRVFIRGFNRPNLKFFVRENLRIKERRQEAVRLVKSLAGAGIVYTLTRKEAEEAAALFGQSGITAAAYHAGLEATQRTAIQNDFQENKFKVIVATIAFGMGVDKADVRFVIHLGMPSSLEGYYQEAGRAGRDGEGAYCILLHSRRDVGLHYHFLQQNKQTMLAQGKSWVEADRIANIKYRQMEKMIAYATTKQCRRRAILSYFVDLELGSHDANCGSCDVCMNYTWKELPQRERRERWRPSFGIDASSPVDGVFTVMGETEKLRVSGTVAETAKLYEANYAPEQIAKARGLGVRTVFDHLVAWYQTGGELDFSRFVTQDEERAILLGIANAPEKDRLKSIKDQLPEGITYEKIKFVLAKLRRIAID